jgi:hypothetical protein
MAVTAVMLLRRMEGGENDFAQRGFPCYSFATMERLFHG